MVSFDFKLDDFQEIAINHIKEGKSVVVCAPTGAGKTCIAEGAIQLALEHNKRIFYTTPLKALSNQKYYDFSKKYGEDKTYRLIRHQMSKRYGHRIGKED